MEEGARALCNRFDRPGRLINSTVAADKLESNNFVILVRNSEQTKNCTSMRCIGLESGNVAGRSSNWNGCSILLVYALEVSDFVICLEVPNPRGNFIDQVMIVAD
jgi:hypothetical protein